HDLVLDLVDLVAVGGLEDKGLPDAERLAVDLEDLVAVLVLDPEVVPDREQLLSHPVLHWPIVARPGCGDITPFGRCRPCRPAIASPRSQHRRSADERRRDGTAGRDGADRLHRPRLAGRPAPG